MAKLKSFIVPRARKCDSKSKFDRLKVRGASFACSLPRISASRTHLCHQPLSAEIDVGQRQRGEGSRGVLDQPAVAHLGKAPQPLDDAEDMLDAGTDCLALSIASMRIFH